MALHYFFKLTGTLAYLGIMRIIGVNHVGIAVLDLNGAKNTFVKKFALNAEEVTEMKDQGVRIVLLDTPNCVLEFMEPIDQEGPVARFLQKNGGKNAIHHIAFDVDEKLDSVGAELEKLGVDLVYPVPRIGAMGHRINFCHPKTTENILVELCES